MLLRTPLTMKVHRRLATASLLLQLAACNRPEPESEDIAAEEEGVVPDLPCGGADLQTDDFNCGTCGNTCEVPYPNNVESGTYVDYACCCGP